MLLVNNLLERFREDLDSSKSFDLAVAWETCGKALEEAVLERGLKVRAIVGTRGNLTGPEALEKLGEIGELRLVPDDCRMFHPKSYTANDCGVYSLTWTHLTVRKITNAYSANCIDIHGTTWTNPAMRPSELGGPCTRF